jgi:RNA polymerase sigma-70 factor (ECF subfamily)
MMVESSEPSPRSCTHKDFIRLFLEAEKDLLRYVMVLIPNAADARDVVQEAAVALWDKIDQYAPEKPFAPWACRFALNEAKMFLRKKARQNRLADEVVDLLEIERMENADRLDARKHYLRECLRTLPSKNAELVNDYYFNELSVEELGKRLERSIDAIYKTLQRVRQALHACIEKNLQMEAKS